MDSFFWMNMFYLSLVSTTFGTTMYFHASAKLGSAKASSYIFLVPFTALLGSWFFLKENPTWTIIAGGFFAVLAVYFINGSIRLIIPKNRTDNE
jgi:drug/metabolite transporter (DMT)-like permease